MCAANLASMPLCRIQQSASAGKLRVIRNPKTRHFYAVLKHDKRMHPELARGVVLLRSILYREQPGSSEQSIHTHRDESFSDPARPIKFILAHDLVTPLHRLPTRQPIRSNCSIDVCLVIFHRFMPSPPSTNP